ncbi:MAG: HD domain-containing protein [Simkaniaceae bacterium]|nr:HD domain-containing protein [Simkaniaceae bacterium]
MSRKKIFDSVHHFIHVDELENDLIHSEPFHRLHFIHQLGAAFFVYPGGTHSRFEHSLGVMELATRIYDQITSIEHNNELIPQVGSKEHIYWRKVMRMAALCHDMGHLPFSHTAERLLFGEKGHEKWTARIIESPYLAPIWEKLDPNRDVKSDVIKIAVGSEVSTPWEGIVSQIVMADFFGADRIDYLIRDAKYTGLPYGMFDYHQMIEMLRILPYQGTWTIGIEESGIESCEALLASRYFMHKRLCQYPSVKSYGFHMARFMKTSFGAALTGDLDAYLQLTDNEIITEMHRAARNPLHSGHFDAACLSLNLPRFKAVPFHEELPDLSHLPEGKYGTEIDPTHRNTLALTIPVLRKDGGIVSGERLSEIKIPQGPTHWVFISPELAEEIYPLRFQEISTIHTRASQTRCVDESLQ